MFLKMYIIIFLYSINNALHYVQIIKVYVKIIKVYLTFNILI